MSNPNSSSSAPIELAEALERELKAAYERITATYSPEVVQQVAVSVDLTVGPHLPPLPEFITIEIEQSPENP